jgi:DNA (cytosine-5)-methyltransferase 1
MSEDIVILDLFSGIGGFSAGLSDAGFNIVTHYYSEVDKHAIANYKYNFKNSKYVGSVTTLDGRAITRPNIITFGSPCQDFSVAGKRAGMGGTRSSLIGEAIRVVAECRPDVFIWENVKGVFSSNSGADFWGVIEAFANIGGYRLEWQLLNTAWVLPQNRERVYLIGHLAESQRDFKTVFPFTESDARINEGTAKTTVNTITAGGHSGGHSGGHHSSMTLLDMAYKNEGVREYTDICPTLNGRDYKEPKCVAQRGRGENWQQQLEERADGVTNTLTGVQKDNMVMIGDSRADEGFRWRKNGLAPAIRGSNQKSGSPNSGLVFTGGLNPHNRGDGSLSRDYSEQDRIYDAEKSTQAATVAATVAATSNSKYLHNSQIRRLTEIECERLQGFPDNWTEYGDYDGVVKKIPKSQRYKLLGNAVTVKIVEMIGKRLIKS